MENATEKSKPELQTQIEFSQAYSQQLHECLHEIAVRIERIGGFNYSPKPPHDPEVVDESTVTGALIGHNNILRDAVFKTDDILSNLKRIVG